MRARNQFLAAVAVTGLAAGVATFAFAQGASVITQAALGVDQQGSVLCGSLQKNRHHTGFAVRILSRAVHIGVAQDAGGQLLL